MSSQRAEARQTDETPRQPKTSTEDAPLARLLYFREEIHGLDDDGVPHPVWMAGIQCPYCPEWVIHEHPLWPSLLKLRGDVFAPLPARCDDRDLPATQRQWYRIALVRPVPLRPLEQYRKAQPAWDQGYRSRGWDPGNGGWDPNAS